MVVLLNCMTCAGATGAKLCRPLSADEGEYCRPFVALHVDFVVKNSFDNAFWGRTLKVKSLIFNEFIFSV